MYFFRTIQSHVRAALFNNGVLTVFSKVPIVIPTPTFGDVFFNSDDLVYGGDGVTFNVTGVEPDSLYFNAALFTYDADPLIYT